MNDGHIRRVVRIGRRRPQIIRHQDRIDTPVVGQHFIDPVADIGRLVGILTLKLLHFAQAEVLRLAESLDFDLVRRNTLADEVILNDVRAPFRELLVVML